MQSKVMTGARAKVYVGTNPIGIFTNVSYGLQYDVQPIFILGRFGPDESVITGQDAVQINASGWRVIGAGPHAMEGARVPRLQDLLFHEEMQITIVDRREDGTEAYTTVHRVRPVGYSTSISARGVQELSISFIGLSVTDESGPQNDPGASSLPDV